MDEDHTTDRLRTSETTLRILKLLRDQEGCRVDEIAMALDIAPSTAYRHLQTLRCHEFVRAEGDVYDVGMDLLRFGGYLRSRKAGYRLAEEYVEKIAKQTGERAQFVVEEGGRRYFLYRRVGEQAVRGDANIGKRGALHCSAAGKAILANLPSERRNEIIDKHGLPKVTTHTITDRDELEKELESIEDQEYAINREESTLGFHALAAPVMEASDTVLGALSVSGPSHRFTGEWFETELPDMMRGISQELELKLEYS